MVHLFTPEEANRKLPEVRKLVSDAVGFKKDLEVAGPREKEKKCAFDNLSIVVSKLTELGIEIKDLDVGLVDFPAVRFNEQVYLCWKLGETEVLYWHSVHEGYRGRKPLKPQATTVR